MTWSKVALGDVSTVESGSGFPMRYQGQADQEIHFYKVSDLSAPGNEREMVRANNTISEAVLKELRGKLFPPGTTIFPKIGGAIATNRKRITTVPCCVDNNVMGVAPDTDRLDAGFLWYLFLSLDLTGFAHGAAMPAIRKSTIQRLSVSLPAVSEQQRIASILDEAFEGITVAKANAEQNVESARAVFESELDAVFSDTSEAYTVTTLGDEIDLLPGFAFKSANYTESEHDVRLLRGDNIVPGSLRWNGVKRWPKSQADEHSRFQLEEGDIVVAMDRPWVSAGLKHAMVDASDLPALLVQRVARLRSRMGLHRRYLLHLIGSAKFMRYVVGAQTGSGVPHISGGQIQSFLFSKPSMEEQERVAVRLDSLSESVRQLESIYRQKTEALDALKRSLLNEAFSGNL